MRSLPVLATLLFSAMSAFAHLQSADRGQAKGMCALHKAQAAGGSKLLSRVSMGGSARWNALFVNGVYGHFQGSYSPEVSESAAFLYTTS